MSYDPAPDLAALIDGLNQLLTSAGANDGARWWRLLSELGSGPYARLRGGLLLDEPGREDQGTLAALREVLAELPPGSPP